MNNELKTRATRRPARLGLVTIAGLMLLLAGCSSEKPSEKAVDNNAKATAVVTPSPAAADLALESISIDGVKLAQSGTVYAITVPATTSTVVAVAKVASPTTSVAFGSGEYVKGTVTQSLQLQPGDNAFAVRILGPDGRSARSSLVITRSK